MDSPLVNRVVKRLLSNCCCQSFRLIRHHNALSSSFKVSKRAAGSYTGLKKQAEKGAHDDWMPKNNIFPSSKKTEFEQYKMTTAEELKKKDRRPKRLKMFMREFIEDSLYNPSYGYFSHQATIFDPGEPFDFRSMRSETEFNTILDDRYRRFEDRLDEIEPNETRQLWHTPTELFRPHYAEAMARYMVSNYKLSLFPDRDLVIYELGAGNGTFMLNVLDYIRKVEPEIYTRTRYNIIEISQSLATLQEQKLKTTADSRGHLDRVNIINQSIFNWNTFEPYPCFFVALEVIDNFGHDLIRYNEKTQQAMQGMVLVDPKGEFYEFYTPDLDQIAGRYLRVRDAASERAIDALSRRRTKWSEKLKSRYYHGMPLSTPEWIPTRLLQFFDVLRQSFPAHRLLLSDFHSLPDSIDGYNAPVVQTRYQRKIVPVSTPLVRQGYFDIFFPTDFAIMEDIYRAVTGRLTDVQSHEDFMKGWAHVDGAMTKNGENPLLSFYKNASVMTTL